MAVGDVHGAGFTDEAEADDDPTVAFEALRASVEAQGRALGGELGLLRRGLEAVLDQLDRLGAPADYGADLGRIVQGLGALDERLRGIEGSPLLRRGAEHYTHVLERGGRDLIQAAVRALEQQTAGLGRLSIDLAGQLTGARERRRQDRWLAGAVGLGLVFGVVATLVLPRLLLPGWLDVNVAATVLGADRWNAGAALMQSGSPQGWRALVDASRLVRANDEVVRACTEAAAKAKKEQRCAITVAPP